MIQENLAVNKKKVGMCKHFHFLTGGLFFLQFFAKVYKMKTVWRGHIFVCFFCEAIHLHFSESLYGRSKWNISRGIWCFFLSFFQNARIGVRFEVPAVLLLKFQVFWNVMLYLSKYPQVASVVPNGDSEAWTTLLYPSWLWSFAWPNHPSGLGGHPTVTTQPRPLHFISFNLFYQNSKLYMNLTILISPAIIIPPGSTLFCVSCYRPPTHPFLDSHHVT
jgi:hypothetical protein